MVRVTECKNDYKQNQKEKEKQKIRNKCQIKIKNKDTQLHSCQIVYKCHQNSS